MRALLLGLFLTLAVAGCACPWWPGCAIRTSARPGGEAWCGCSSPVQEMM